MDIFYILVHQIAICTSAQNWTFVPGVMNAMMRFPSTVTENFTNVWKLCTKIMA